MADSHEADRAGFSVDDIDDAEPTDTILPESVKFSQ